MAKWVYLFREGNADMRNLLGGKGANLAEMTNLGLPIPCLLYTSTAEEEEQEKLFEAEAKALKKDLFTCPVDREPVHAAVSRCV